MARSPGCAHKPTRVHMPARVVHAGDLESRGLFAVTSKNPRFCSCLALSRLVHPRAAPPSELLLGGSRHSARDVVDCTCNFEICNLIQTTAVADRARCRSMPYLLKVNVLQGALYEFLRRAQGDSGMKIACGRFLINQAHRFRGTKSGF